MLPSVGGNSDDNVPCWQIWDKPEWDQEMNTFWDSNCRDPWKCFSIGEFDCMLATPENQCQEAYHRTILKTKIPGQFKGSTEHVMQHAVPQLVKMDGLLLPSKINFEVRRTSQYTSRYSWDTPQDTPEIHSGYTWDIPWDAPGIHQRYTRDMV